MTHRTITAEEARTLREAATPGPWENRTRGNDAELLIQPVVRATVDHWARPKLHCSLGDRLLIAAAPDLAATVEALYAEVERLRAQNWELRSALQDYLDNDDTNEGGKWEESNAPWLAIKRRAAALLAALERAP